MPARIVLPSTTAIDEATRTLQDGGLVAFPTETVYGLGADATNGEAVARIFAAKRRPTFNPLIVHVPDIAEAWSLAEFPALARTLAEALWPGPLTLVLPRRDGAPISELATAGLSTIALRSPDHPIARALLKAAGRPIAAPSANRSGRVSATLAAHVAEDLGDHAALIIDGGPAVCGIESTVVSIAGDDVQLLRPGVVTAEAIEQIIGKPLSRRETSDSAPNSPGQLVSHYAPRASVRLNATSWTPADAVLAFGKAPSMPALQTINLSPSGNLIEAAANLFAALRMLDTSGAATIAVMPIPNEGLGEAINDRLRRAAAPRPNQH